MRIRLSQLRQIIKEELQRKIIIEGVLDDSLQPQNLSSNSESLNAIVEKIHKSTKDAVISQNPKEVNTFLKIKFHPDDQGKESCVLDFYFESRQFINAITDSLIYLKAHPDSKRNEFVDELLGEDYVDEIIGKAKDGSAKAFAFTNDHVEEAIMTMMNDSIKPTIIKYLTSMGFTQKGDYMAAQVSLDPKSKERDKTLKLHFDISRDHPSIRMTFFLSSIVKGRNESIRRKNRLLRDY